MANNLPSSEAEESQIIADLSRFLDLDSPDFDVGPIYNERSLQLELACCFRGAGYRIEFERPFEITPLFGSTRRVKRDLDLLLLYGGRRTALELKVPLSGRVPETMYDFCDDLAFVEGLIRAKIVEAGFALLVTDNRQFWQGRPQGIYEVFRRADVRLTGSVKKPTGGVDETLVLSGSYDLAGTWRNLGNSRLIDNARYLLVRVQ